MIGYQGKNSNQSVLIAKWTNTRIELEQSGLETLKNFNQGQINLICLQGFGEKNYEVLGKAARYQNNPDNSMMMRLNPVFNPRIQKYILILQIKASDQAAKQQLHLLAAIISNVIVLPVSPEDSLSYLGVVARRSIIQSTYQKQASNVSKLSSLLCLLPSVGQKGSYLRDDTENLLSKLETEKILNEVITSYPSIRGLQCPEINLVESDVNFQQKMMQQIEISSQNLKENSEIMYGPILVEFIKNLTGQINQSRTVINLQKAEDDITIDQGYEAFRAGVQKYHKVGLNLIDKNSKPDDNQLQQMLTIAKNKAFDDFYNNDGSVNTSYRRMLEDYINQKNEEVIKTYSGQQWNKNLQILQSESKSVLNQISTSKTKDPAIIMSYIEQMTKAYEQNARGPQKYQILNDYMKVFTPIALEVDPDKQAKLKQEMKRNQQLLKRIQELKKKKSGGFCSSCAIF